jgi:hypothetical protein
MRQFPPLCVLVAMLTASLTAPLALGQASPNAGTPAATEAPALDIPDVALRGNLLPDHKQQILARLTYFAEKIRTCDEKDASTLAAARNGLLGTFRHSDSTTFQYTVAEIASGLLTPLLDDPSSVKQLTVALAISQMPQVTIQSALEKMVTHPNPGVRYLGWKGYRAAAPRVLVQGAEQGKTMFATLARRAAEETSGPVVAAIWQMLRMDIGNVRPAGGQADPRRQALKILSDTWRVHCVRIMNGDLSTAIVAGKGLDTALEFVASSPAGSPDGKTGMQLVADLMWSAAKGYGRIYDAEDEKGRESNPVLYALATLLTESEGALNKRFGYGALDQRDYIRFVLSDSTIKKKGLRGSAMLYYLNPQPPNKQYGVSAWVDELKAKYGIEEPTAARFAANGS